VLRPKGFGFRLNRALGWEGSTDGPAHGRLPVTCPTAHLRPQAFLTTSKYGLSGIHSPVGGVGSVSSVDLVSKRLRLISQGA
jgi:hypothetical protein